MRIIRWSDAAGRRVETGRPDGRRASRRLDLLQPCVLECQPLDAGIAEVHLHAGVVPAAFGLDDHADAELGMADALADAPGRRGRGRLLRAYRLLLPSW